MSQAAATIERPTSTMLQHIHLAPRRMQWNFSDVPACPVEGDPNLAAFLLAISYFVVVFEDYGIPAVRQTLPLLKDHPALHREAQAFMTQEALHSQGHVQLNTHLEERCGIDTTVIRQEFKRFMEDLHRDDVQEALALVAAFEHVIYSVADWYEHATDLWPRIHPELHRLIMWHAMEETEHTAVCYDIYQHLYADKPGSYAVRLKALAVVTRITIRTLSRMWGSLVPQMEKHSGLPASSIKPWWHVGRVGSGYLGDYLSFLKPNFTPWSAPGMADILPSIRPHMVPQWQSGGDWIDVEIASVREVSADVRTYELVAKNGAALPAWSAGAHIDVEIETGIVRHYSLCGDPADVSRYRIAVKREVLGRGGSLRLHQELGRGSSLRISSPRNLFALESIAPPQSILLAGGIGITPIMAMAHTLHAQGAEFSMHVCSRSHQFLPFAQDIAQWAFAAKVQTHLDDQSAGGRVDIGALIPVWDALAPQALYICGPAPFIDAACAKAKAQGWPEAAVHFERFAHDSAGPKKEDKAFTLVLERSNKTLEVPANMTILEAMEMQGLKPSNSCREGICGSCICKVKQGGIDHRDAVLSTAEQEAGHKIAICVSRAKGDVLTLDL